MQVNVLDNKNLESLTPTLLYLYGEKELGDWIEQVPAGLVASVKVRLEYTISKEITSYDGGTILRDVAYFNLILLEVVT